MEGNQMSIRTALETLRNRFDHDVMVYQDRYFKFSGWHWHKKAAEAARWRDVFHELREVCDAALSAPPRQCDVGTPDEQERRYKATGEVYHTLTLTNALAWAQMPYAAQEGGAA